MQYKQSPSTNSSLSPDSSPPQVSSGFAQHFILRGGTSEGLRSYGQQEHNQKMDNYGNLLFQVYEFGNFGKEQSHEQTNFANLSSFEREEKYQGNFQQLKVHANPSIDNGQEAFNPQPRFNFSNMRKPPMPNAGGGSQLKGQLHTMIGEGNSISHQVSRPVTNHKHYQGDIIKTSNLQINPFSDEIIAQLKHSENLIVSEEVAIAPFSSSSDEGNSPVNQHPLELEEFQEGMIMPLDKIKQDRQSKSKNPFSQQKLSIAMLQNTPVKSNYQNDEVPVVEMLPLIQKQQSDVRQYLRCRASNKRVKPMISHNPESNAKTYQYNIPSQSPSPEPRQTLLSTQKMQNLMFLDASQIIKDAGGQRRISPRISDVDYYNPSGSTVVINQEGVGNNSKGSIACIISGGESSQQFTTQQIQDGNQQKYAQQTKHGSFSRKLPQSIQLNKLLSTQTFNETTKYAFQKESFQSKDPSFGKSCLQETIGNSDSQQPPQQQIIQNFNTICNIYIFNNGDCNNQKLTRGSEEHLSHPGADEKIFGHLPGALGSNQRNNLYSNTLNGNISQNGRQQSTGRQKVMWLNQQSKQNSLGGAGRNINQNDFNPLMKQSQVSLQGEGEKIQVLTQDLTHSRKKEKQEGNDLMRGKFGLQNLNFSKVLDSTNTLNELNPESMLSPTVLKRNQIQFLGADSNFVTKFAQNTANSSGGPHRRIQSINLGNANLFATTTQTPTTQNNLGLKPHLVLDKQKNSLKIETTHQKPLRPLKLVQPNRAISETPKLLEYRAPNDMPQQFITNNIRTPVEYVTAETQQQFFYRRQSPAMQKMVMQQKIIHRLAQNQLRQENQSVLMTQSTPLQSQYE